ncbi:MAG: ketopantoate reductase family protein [Firmicutes bacterium]|jgi:2-dehydropantoate 2-reductase|nr:ketopantoate reductase family protein [Bacillota bacterium]
MAKKMKTLLIGAGAMGTIIGALATEGGSDITIVDAYKEHVNALNEAGAKIIGNIQKQIPVKACLPTQIQGKFDLILSITKHGAIEDSLIKAKPYMADDCIVLTLQNGFPEEKAMKLFPEERVMGGSMEFSGTFKGPGITELASEPHTLGITFGSCSGEITDKVRQVKQVLDPVGNIAITTNIKGLKWAKLTDNTCFSGLPTALGCEVGKVLDDDFALDCAAHIGSECAQVIEALGIEPVEIFGLLPTVERLVFKTDQEKQKVKEYWRKVEEPFRGQIASMLQDVRNGRKCEINEINGQVSRTGGLVGVATPYCDKVVELVTKLQCGELKLENAWENLNAFKSL